MKRKIFALITAFVLIMLLCLSLVACNDSDSTIFKFSENMTVDEIIDTLGKLNSFTYVAYEYSGYGDIVGLSEEYYYDFKNDIFDFPAIDDRTYIRNSENREYTFYKDGVMYTYITGKEQYTKKQCSEEQWGIWSETYRKHFTDRSSFTRCLENGDYTIEDGNLKVHKVSDIWVYTIKDINKTKVKIPKEFSDYKKRAFTDESDDTSGGNGDISTFTPDMIGYDGSEVTIKFYHTMSKALSEVLQYYIDEFNKLYPNITVEHKQVGGYDDICDTITSGTTGSKPNMAYCFSDHIALYNMTNAVIPLDSFISCTKTVTRADGTTETLGLSDAQKEDFIQAFYNEGKQFGDDKMYMLPLCKSTEVLYYNKTYFDANNLTVPTTWDEMEAVCRRIKEIESAKGNDCIPLGYDSESNWFITMCEQYGSPYTSVTGEHFLFNNDTNKAFIQKFKDWYNAGYFTTQTIYGGYTSGLFTQKTGTKSYMSIASSAAATWSSNGKFEVGIAPIPQVDVNNPKSICRGPSLCMFNTGDGIEATATWLFIKYLTTNVEFQSTFSMNSGYMPVLKSVAQNDTYKEYLQSSDINIQALSTKICLEQTDTYFSPDAFYGSNKARTEVGNLLIVAITGEKTIDEAFRYAIEECKYYAS